MSVVTEYLVQLIAKQVEEKGLVVWYDPEKAYGTAGCGAFPAEDDCGPIRRQLPHAYDTQIDHLLNEENDRLGWSCTCRWSAPRPTVP